MARTELDRAVVPSVLDRLTDLAPDVSLDPRMAREESSRRYRESVQRDLDWLLNTRRTQVEREAGVEVEESLWTYGLRDFAGLTTSSENWRERLTDSLYETIRRFEPRLLDVRVELANDEDPALRQVRFTITAMLDMDPSPEHVVFDTVLDVTNGTYGVEDRS